MLYISATLSHQVIDHARAGYSSEICGLLVGWESDDRESRTVTEVHRAENLRADRRGDRYELDPKTHLRVQRQARRRGLRIVGVYHSHPDAAAIPSETDRARATEIWGPGPSWSYLIVPVGAEETGQPRSWILTDGQFVEEAIERQTAV